MKLLEFCCAFGFLVSVYIDMYNIIFFMRWTSHPLHEELHKFKGITFLWTQSLEVNQQY